MPDLWDPENLLGPVKTGELEAIRQSTLAQLQVCGLRVGYDRRAAAEGRYSTGSARAIGTGYHAALECFYERYHPHLDGWTGRSAEVVTTCIKAGHAAFNAEKTRDEYKADPDLEPGIGFEFRKGIAGFSISRQAGREV